MMTTVILRVATRLLVPLSLVFAMFIYFKGHQSPGGGFVAGLVAALAMIVHRMSEGPRSLTRMLPFTERSFIAMGLLLAVSTGLGALLAGLPFFTSEHGYLKLPTSSGKPLDVEWATVMVFDLGVFFVVMGVVVGMINALSRELEQ